MRRVFLFLFAGAFLVSAGLGVGGVFAFFTSQDVSPDAVQVQATNFTLTVGVSGTLPPLQVVGFFPTASGSQSYPITLDATPALQADLQISVASSTPPTTPGFSGVLEVTIDVDGSPVYGFGPTKTLQDLENESPVVLATVNGGDTVNVTMTVTWPDGAPSVDNLYVGAQYQADITVDAVQTIP